MKTGEGVEGRATSFTYADDILLFAEATKVQIDCIMEGLRDFSNASGQKIKYSKSYIFFSHNLSDQITTQLSSRIGIRKTTDLGVYLGHQIQHLGQTNGSNGHLIERVRSRLD